MSTAAAGNGEGLSDAIGALSQCAQSTVALYHLLETTPTFLFLRSACYYEAMLYSNQISPKNMGFVDNVRYIASTYRQAVYLSSYTLLKSLPVACREVESGGKTLALQHNVVLNRLMRIDNLIQKEKKSRKPKPPSLFSRIKNATGLGGGSNGAGLESFDILDSSLRDFIQVVTSMQEFIQKMLELARLIRKLEEICQWDKVIRSLTAGNRISNFQHRELSYLEVLGTGANFIRECEEFRTGSKRLMESLRGIRDYVPENVQTEWFQEIKNEWAKR